MLIVKNSFSLSFSYKWSYMIYLLTFTVIILNYVIVFKWEYNSQAMHLEVMTKFYILFFHQQKNVFFLHPITINYTLNTNNKNTEIPSLTTPHHCYRPYCRCCTVHRRSRKEERMLQRKEREKTRWKKKNTHLWKLILENLL